MLVRLNGCIPRPRIRKVGGLCGKGMRPPPEPTGHARRAIPAPSTLHKGLVEA